MNGNPQEEAAMRRGVFVDEAKFSGVVTHIAVDSHGRLLMSVTTTDANADEVIRFMESWLDRHDPPAPALRIVAPDGRAKRSRGKSKPPTLQLA